MDILGHFLTSFEVSVLAELLLLQRVDRSRQIMIYSEMKTVTF